MIQKDIEIFCESEIFKAQSKETTVLGWKHVLGKAEDREIHLPDMNVDQDIHSKTGEIVKKTTRPKNHFSEETLISALKNVSKLIDDPNLKKKLNSGKSAIGPFIGFPSPGLVEYMGWLGFDFVVIDCEHGPMDYETAENMIRAAELSNTTPILRIGLIKKLREYSISFL